MQNKFLSDDIIITPEKQGADQYLKLSCPLCYGRFGEITTANHVFTFTLNGEIRTISGRRGSWLESAEWLKRSPGNDWAYFSAGGYNGAFNYTGEYYVPCLYYETNSIFGNQRFKKEAGADALGAWENLDRQIAQIDISRLGKDTAHMVESIREMPADVLGKRADKFHEIIGGKISVLPPDTRHVEYDVIPIIISDGCLYNCAFCRVKSGRAFSCRSKEDIKKEILRLKDFYGPDLINYSALFLGDHDALLAGGDLIMFAAKTAWDIFEMADAVTGPPRLFLFGSVASLAAIGEDLLCAINRLPFYTYINVGLESGDSKTLRMLGKPIDAKMVASAFDRMVKINRRFENIEVTANFVMGKGLPKTHLPSIIDLTRNHMDRPYAKGAVYFSPLADIGPKEKFLAQFNNFKGLCRLPAFLYLIQRL
ncbi:MAG: radical SAM protein [Deltaproteobacteria bacterium]|nr:radical SAM protein [Deltaproteobacteria bacterium]